MVVHVVGPREYPPSLVPPLIINTTSRSRTWSQGLSPFYLGPCPLYPGAVAPESKTMEGLWQYTKVYPQHVGPGRLPLPTYFDWARAGWEAPRAVRYPMGREAVPAFSWWAGEALGYVEARKRIYIPIYAKAVVPTPSFQRLLEQYKRDGEITLWDFDGYDHLRLGMTLRDVVNEPKRKMGHAFVLAHLLETLANRVG